MNYSCNKNCVGLRFFVTDQEIISGNAENMSPEKNKNVTWYEVKQDENGKKCIVKLGSNKTEWEKTNISFAYSDNYFSQKKQWKIGPQEKYGKDKFLVHFNKCCKICVHSDKSEIAPMISKDINSHIDINNLDDSIKIYGCMQLKPNGKFYFDWEEKTLQEKFNKDIGTGNSHNDYMENVFAMRFYITKQNISFEIGNEVTENMFSGNVSNI